jgi:hypothetical protein
VGDRGPHRGRRRPRGEPLIKVPDRHLTLILLANSDGLKWDNPLDKAEVEKSPFVAE